MEKLNLISAGAVPAILAVTAITAMLKGTDTFSALTEGAKEGFRVVLRILPGLVMLLPAVYMLRASGFTDALTDFISPVLSFFGIPAETASLMLIRPFSGSGALSVGSEIMSQYGAESLIGRTAAVMLGSTETTFYTVSVYFGALGIKNTRYAIPAALCADIAGFIAASFFTRLFFT